MTEPSAADLERLVALLQEATGAPLDHAAELRTARAAATGAGLLAAELLQAECDWLQRCAESHPQAGLAGEMHAARVALLRSRLRNLDAARVGDVEALFDLADVAAEADFLGQPAIAAAAAAACAQRARQQADPRRLREEAIERWAALAAVEAEVPLPLKIRQLRAAGTLLLQVPAAIAGKTGTRLGRRLLHAADDRELAARLERLLGRTGVTALETTSLLLLLVVLASLLVEATVALSPGATLWLRWIDALACSWFVLEFAGKLALVRNRGSWLLRNALTDLLPAIPAVLFLLPAPAGGVLPDELVFGRLFRLLRIGWAARYVQALRPLLRAARLLLLLVRGADALVQRLAPLLDRNLVFFGGVDPMRPPVLPDRRQLLFLALQREQVLLAAVPVAEQLPALRARAAAVAQAADSLPPVWVERSVDSRRASDVSVERACSLLWSLRPEDLSRYLTPGDQRAIDRVVCVLSAPLLRWLPLVRRLAVRPLPATAEERLVAAGRRVAAWLWSWQSRLEFWADLHGIVTGPQILDRVATALVRASQRPAVRLLLFGGLFLLCDLLIPAEGISRFLRQIVVGPLLILGTFCLLLLSLGWWLKRVAGEASATFRLISEAHFASLLHLVKRRHERVDLQFLAARVFRDDAAPGSGAALLRQQLVGARTGVPARLVEPGAELSHDANRTALLYLHFLDGAMLHESDVKTTEQLLANLSLENLRHGHLRFTRRDRKRLRKLSLDEGSIFSGPYLWFQFITESVAVETAKRIAEYNRHCLTRLQAASATPAQLAAMQDWLLRRADPRGSRTLERQPGSGVVPNAGYQTTEFNALDFLTADAERDAHIQALFGDEVLATLQQDRRHMIREIFGTSPIHRRPVHARSVNLHRFYQQNLSGGRMMLLPLLFAWQALRALGLVTARLRAITREVLRPDLAVAKAERGTAPFAVALRKIHRMKAPGLLEAMRMRVQVDPAYSGAPSGWSRGAGFAATSELQGDLDFLRLADHERRHLLDAAAAVRADVELLHASPELLPTLAAIADPARDAGELAVTVAWITDKDCVRTLAFAERWRDEELPALAATMGERGRPFDLWCRVRGWFVVHPVDRWRERHGCAKDARVRRALLRAWPRDAALRARLRAWAALPAGTSPRQHVQACLSRQFSAGELVRREVLALRAVQSLSVLDIRNYRDLVFRLGGYADDGEDPALGEALP